MSDEASLSLDLAVSPAWRHVDRIRTAILNAVSAILKDDERCHDVGMVASELVENAIKFGDWERAEKPRLHVAVRGDSRGLSVEVRSPVDPSAENLARLREIIQALERAPTPAQAFRERLLAIAGEGSSGSQSRLGILRIASEAGGRVSAEVQGSELRVTVQL
jgi:hypothetical protein